MAISCIQPPLPMHVIFISFRTTQWRRPPHLLIRGLLVGDVGAMTPQLHAKHTLLRRECDCTSDEIVWRIKIQNFLERKKERECNKGHKAVVLLLPFTPSRWWGANTNTCPLPAPRRFKYQWWYTTIIQAVAVETCWNHLVDTFSKRVNNSE